MTGLLLLVLVGLWMWACVAITRAVLRRVQSPSWRWLVAPTLFTVLLTLPVTDEIVGGFQLRALCDKNAVLKIDAEKAKGKTVRVVIQPSNEVVPGQALRTLHSHFSYRIVDSEEEIARYDTYVIKGGWFIRALGISNNNSPLTVGQPFCSPPNRGLLDRTYGFTLIN
jgi:hypothetical protein